MKTLVNPQSMTIRLHLSDGSERVVPAWSIVVLPDHDADGQPLTVVSQEAVLRSITSAAETSAPTELATRAA
jgi:hypothetical protein